MAPNITPSEWQRFSLSYAALDEYLRWAQSPQGGQFGINPVTQEIDLKPRYGASGKVTGRHFPKTTYRNLLDHLNHVFTNRGTGPSVLDLVLDMLSVPGWELESLRLVSKSIGTAATKTMCRSLRISAALTTSLSSPAITKFIPRFLKHMQDTTRKFKPGVPPRPWSLNASYVKELDFCNDPVAMEKYVDLYKTFDDQLTVTDLGAKNPGLAYRATMQEGKKYLEPDRDEAHQEVWHSILLFIEYCKNLEVFKFSSSAWQPFELLPVLGFNCPKLKLLELSFFGPLLEGPLKLTRTLGMLRHLKASEVAQALISLPLDVNITLTISVRRDEYIIPLIFHVAAFAKKLDTLSIDRGSSDKGYGAWDQGWQKLAPLMMHGRPVEIATTPILEVRSIKIAGIGRNSRYIMPLLDTTDLREITLTDCLHVEFILQPLARSALKLTSVSVTLKELHADFVEAPERYHHLKVQDYRYVLDFVRAGNFSLTSLMLWADFADEKRKPKSHSLLVPDLWFAIQAHMATLAYLMIYNGKEDFRVTDIEELGRCAPHLQELRITARMGNVHSDEPTPRTEGLTLSLKRALLSFRTHKTLRTLMILDSYSGDINSDYFDDVNLSKHMRETSLEAVTYAIANEVPIKLFTYFEWPCHASPICHFYYNKKPFEPDIAWGVYPSPPPPVLEGMEYFKGFDFHEKLSGFKGLDHNEQRTLMLAKHSDLVKELCLWHFRTKRGGATFSPEPLKLPSESSRKVERPIPPADFIGDLGSPYDSDAWATNSAANQALTRKKSTGSALIPSDSDQTMKWYQAPHPNTPKYYINPETKRSRWDNPNRFTVSSKEQGQRLSEADRDYLFGKKLPSYEPLMMTEEDFNDMSGRDLYHWEDLYSYLDDADQHKLSVLETKTNDQNLEEQYALLEEYAPAATSWDISNPYNFVAALHNLCHQRRYYILQKAIAKGLVLPTPITEASFWAKPTNDRLVWLQVNGYINPTLYPDLTLAFALRLRSDVSRQEADAATTSIRRQLTSLWADCKKKHVPHAKERGIITENPITEGTFNNLEDRDLYTWAVSRFLMSPIHSAAITSSKGTGASLARDSDVNVATPAELQSIRARSAGARRAELLRLAIARSLVIVNRQPEAAVVALSDADLYTWARGRDLLAPLPTDATPPAPDADAAEVAARAAARAAWAAAKRDNIMERAKAARYIIPTPIPVLSARQATQQTVARLTRSGKKGMSGTRGSRFAPYPDRGSAGGGGVLPPRPSPRRAPRSASPPAGELEPLAREELIMKVVRLCANTGLMRKLGMTGFMEILSGYDGDQLVRMLLKGSPENVERILGGAAVRA